MCNPDESGEVLRTLHSTTFPDAPHLTGTPDRLYILALHFGIMQFSLTGPRHHADATGLEGVGHDDMIDR